MKRLLSLVLLIGLAGIAWPAGATSRSESAPPSCAALVVRVPAGGVGLPLKSAPSWWSVDAPGVLQVGQEITIYAQITTPPYGEVWFQVADGWAQAYSGPSTDVVQLVLVDPACGAGLPVY